MNFFPNFKITLLNGFIMIIPLLIIRLWYPKKYKGALDKLEYFPDTRGLERLGLTVYFITNTFIIFSPLVMAINKHSIWIGLPIYLIGLIIFFSSIITFSKHEGFVRHGIYHYSRNPMYVGYFLIFLGMAISINSIAIIIIVLIYQLAVHLLILSEERWCIDHFLEYREYMNRVRRYL